MELFKLFGTIALNGVDETHSALDGITSKASGIGSKIASGVGTVAKTVGKAAVGAVAATTTAVAAIGKTAVESYAEYEQLVGGVDTLFKESSEKVQEYADEAYISAGLSANDYMETVTSFSAKLLQDLEGDTQTAADMANMAIKDMADNANKMGTNMSMIQNAYQGFAKQNYTMLDNLKLGYGGTQQEMARLLADAQEIDSTFDAVWTIDNKGHLEAEFSDIIEAIHIIQENMEITGTTAKEASQTIQGSFSSMKASWSNLVTGMARDDSDISELISQFTTSIETFAANLLPRIEETIRGIGDMVTQIAPFFVESVTKLVVEVGPDLLAAGAELANTLITSFANSLIDTSPILAPIGQMILEVKESLSNAFATLGENIDWESVFSGLQGALEVVCGLVEDLASGFEDFVTYATTEGTPLNDVFLDIKDSAQQVKDWFSENWGSIADTFGDVKTKIGEAAENIIEAFGNILAEVNRDDGIKSGLTWIKDNVFDPLAESIGNIASIGGSVASILGDIIAKLISAGKDESTFLGKAVAWFKNDLANAFDNVKEALEFIANLLKGDLVGAFGSAKTIGENVANAWSEKFEKVKKVIQDIIDAIKNFDIGDFAEGVKEKASNLWSDIKDGWNNITDAWNEAESDQTKEKRAASLEGNVSEVDPVIARKYQKPTGAVDATKNSNTRTKDRVDFYASGAVLTKPTAFGLNPYTGKTMVGGEDGAEAIAPIDVLQGYVSEAVEAKTSGMNDTLNRILDALIVMNDNMGANMREAMDGVSLRMNNRELARAVKAVT